MKKFVFTMIVLAAIAATFGAVGVAYAKGPGQVTETASGWMGGNGSRNGLGVGYAITGEGILHDYMISEYAKALNVSETDLEARLENGETMSQIALSEGLTFDQFRTLMVEVRNQAIVLAVNDGVLTQAQADWMTQRGAGQMSGGYAGNGMYGVRQAGQGQFLNPNCPYYAASTP
jgi:hypothetical protein